MDGSYGRDTSYLGLDGMCLSGLGTLGIQKGGYLMYTFRHRWVVLYYCTPHGAMLRYVGKVVVMSNRADTKSPYHRTRTARYGEVDDFNGDGHRDLVVSILQDESTAIGSDQ